MKLYYLAGQWFGRRADAGREAEIVELQTDANSLAAFLNDFGKNYVDHAEDAFTMVVERQDPPVEPTISSAERSVQIDEAFENLPVTHQLTLTALALENARAEIGRLKALERGGMAKPEIAGDDGDDELFA